jgi:hypothetical protein
MGTMLQGRLLVGEVFGGANYRVDSQEWMFFDKQERIPYQ